MSGASSGNQGVTQKVRAGINLKLFLSFLFFLISDAWVEITLWLNSANTSDQNTYMWLFYVA